MQPSFLASYPTEWDYARVAEPSGMRVPRDPSEWRRVRRRFVWATAVMVAWVVGGGVIAAWLSFGGAVRALIAGGTVLVFVTVALAVVYARLRRTYLPYA